MDDLGSVRPQLKHSTPAYVLGDSVHIASTGQTTEIADPDGWVRRLLQLLDGSRTVAEVWRQLVADHPLITQADVVSAIRQLDDARFLLDARHSPDGVLDDYELGRWTRNINFFGSYARLADNHYLAQRRLRDARVTLIGLGGLGSHLLMDMAATGIGHVRVVEFDNVELSNLNRQILYGDQYIGQPKIDVAVRRVKEFSPRIEIDAVRSRVNSAADVAAVADGADVVVCVADRPKMEIALWVNEGCVRTGVPLLTGGLETQRAIYYAVLPGETGCVECWRRHVAETDPVAIAVLNEKRALQITGDNTAFCPLVTMTTGYLLGDLVRLLSDVAPLVAAGRLMQVQFDDYAFTEAERWDRNPDCPICAGVPPRSRPRTLTPAT
jgi:molybdopterin/thiamine biosynthesis adenylyltransferase